ncbi:MAG: hypothetical protein ACM65M_19205 [Microcoleus sp.]
MVWVVRSGKQHNISGTSSTLHYNRLGACYTIAKNKSDRAI